MKKSYIAPQIDSVMFETQDIITVSIVNAVRAYSEGEKVDIVDFNDLRG